MSSSKSNSNSNKTAHVMNLLRKNNASATPPAPADPPVAEQKKAQPQTPPTAEAPVQTQTSAPVQAQAPAPAPQAPPIISALNADTEISLQIRDALNEAFDREETADAQAFQPDPQVIAPDPSLAPKEERPAPVVPEHNWDEEPPKQPVVPQPEPAKAEADPTPKADTPSVSAPVQKQEDSSPKTEPDDDFALYNIARRLVEENVDKYIKAFEVCTCRRCRNDIIALSLNYIPPKYVVMHPAELVLRSDMYGIRHHGEITAQIMRACKQVKEHPNH